MGEQGNGGEAFPHGFQGALFRSAPPVQKGSIMVPRRARHAEPGEYLVPNLSVKQATEQ